jgi:NADH dehydrogenase
VSLRTGDARDRIAAHTVIWAAGVRANALAEKIAMAAGIELDRQGRVPVTPTLEIEGFPDVFVIGDMAACAGPDGKPLPGVAPVAMQQGAYVARTIETRLSRGDTGPFRYRDRGSMATIGRSRAVADLGWIAFGGFPAWVTWLFVHLMYLVEFENRVLVLFQWSWNYLTWNRGARLITGEAESDADQRG